MIKHKKLYLFMLSAIVLTHSFSLSAQESVESASAPLGTEKTAKTKMLETGAKLLQSNDPIDGFDVYLVGFHPMKDNPNMQLEAHHYCNQVNQDFAQCVLFDGNTSSANMNGVEYIISEKLFNNLPEEEKQYWHPHNGEILSGQLVAPGIPQVAEKSLLKDKMNSYGKTWHFWNTGHLDHEADHLPLGKPHLAWSFNRFGEAKSELIKQRDQQMGIDTEQKRQDRTDLRSFAKPQSGVNDLQGQFHRSTENIPGVVDIKNATAAEN